MNGKKLAQWLMVPLTVILVVLLLTQASVTDIAGELLSLGPLKLAVSLALFVVLYALRTARFAFMLGRRDYGRMFGIVCTHSMANNVMPFRTGELTFVYLAKTRLATPAGVGAAVIAIARLYDLLAICLMFIAVLLLAGDGQGYFARFIPAIVLCAAALAMLIAAVLWLNRPISMLTARLFSMGILRKLMPLQLKVEQVCGYCDGLRPWRSIAWIMAMTVAMWAAMAMNFYILASGMGLGLGFWTAISGALLAIIFVALPIQGVGNFGSFELAWSAIFIALGAPVEAAVISGFAVHVITLAISTVLWLYGLAADYVSARGSEPFSGGRRAPP